VSDSRSVTLIGLPRTGKSTYLGALWMIIQDDRATDILEVDIRGDRSYLERLGERVALLQEMKRTEVDSDDGLELTVELKDFGELALRIPDLSGETLRLLVEERTWHPLLRQGVDDSDAVLLFVHPDKLRIPVRTNFTAGILAELMTTVPEDDDEESGVDPATSPEASPASPDSRTATTSDRVDVSPPFTPHVAATAAKLIDAVENILDARQGRPMKLGIVVSAWDQVLLAWPSGENAPTPVKWIERRLPALWQVLVANSDRVDAAVFGVSAIGGRLPDDYDMLMAKGSVYDRAYALSQDGTTVPFVAPITWALT